MIKLTENERMLVEKLVKLIRLVFKDNYNVKSMDAYVNVLRNFKINIHYHDGSCSQRKISIKSKVSPDMWKNVSSIIESEKQYYSWCNYSSLNDKVCGVHVVRVL